ncbi:MAG: amidohydrolase family protein [Candidatus Rokubacteria bacterium]|nr:amidohydrolase family protein [Candidatus Rokubacteria bacterium]
MAGATLLLHDTTLVTADPAGAIHTDAAIVIAGDRIAALGPTRDLLARYPAAERISARGRAVLPGFANTHTHFPMTLARGIYEDLSPPHRPPFEGGLAHLPLPELSRGELEVMVRLAALEAIRSGTTLVLEDGTRLDRYADVLVASGLRYLACERAWDRARASIGQPGPFELDRTLADEGLERVAAFHARWNNAADGRIRAGVAAWAPDMVSPELFARLRGLQDSLETIATLHLNQIWGEVAAVREQRGMLPAEYVARTGFLSERVVAAHCRCMTAGEERLLGDARAAVAFNACIAARRGLSPRIAELERAGCLITMGTDNMAEDMIEVMRTGMFMERVRREDGRQPTPEDMLVWATRNGYRALGVQDGGSLAPGHKADLIVVDLERPHLSPAIRVVSTLVHQAQPADVVAVMVDGRWVMRDGRILTIDEAAVVREARQVARSAWKRLFERRPDLAVPSGFDFATD